MQTFRFTKVKVSRRGLYSIRARQLGTTGTDLTIFCKKKRMNSFIFESGPLANRYQGSSRMFKKDKETVDDFFFVVY
jgi:hypothetical protein